MQRYLIHTCNDRLWYVNDYLIPSMKEQGIKEKHIGIYLDKDNEGCLLACMKAFSSVPFDDNNMWHLQDDIIISSNFAEKTKKHSIADILCGYCYEKDENVNAIGYVRPTEMWYSFPCIRIPNKIARQFVGWFYNKAMQDPAYGACIRSRKHDDSLFHMFMEDYYPDAIVKNMKPNLVDHIDYLIGGSKANHCRLEKETHAAYFKDSQLVKDLEKKLLKNS